MTMDTGCFSCWGAKSFDGLVRPVIQYEEEAEVVITRKFGSILYSDMTVTPVIITGTKLTGIVTGKTPIGVVFDTDEKLAVALEDAPDQLQWGTNPIQIWGRCVNTPIYCSKEKGKENTVYLINNVDWFYRYPAAEYCYNYTTTGTKIGDWFLPSYGELSKIYKQKDDINIVLDLLDKPLIKDEYYWSSTEAGAGAAWILYMANNEHHAIAKDKEKNLRPIMQYK